MYFTSKALQGAEERYPRVEILALALIVSARRLRPYFQAHSIRVLTEHPLKKILHMPDVSGRLVNWAIEIGKFDIEFLPKTAIKGQVLAIFLAVSWKISNFRVKKLGSLASMDPPIGRGVVPGLCSSVRRENI